MQGQGLLAGCGPNRDCAAWLGSPQVDEIQKNIASRRNRIFLLMEEVGRGGGWGGGGGGGGGMLDVWGRSSQGSQSRICYTAAGRENCSLAPGASSPGSKAIWWGCVAAGTAWGRVHALLLADAAHTCFYVWTGCRCVGCASSCGSRG